jgi:hypothetical protein
VAAEAAPDERPGAPVAAEAAVAPDEGLVARLPGAVEAPASLQPEPDVAAVAQPGVAARPAEFAASARPAQQASQRLRQVWAAAVAAEPRLAFVPLPEQSALLQGPEPSRQLSADPREVPAHSFPAFSRRLRLPAHSGQPLREASSLAGSGEPISRWDSARLEQVPSHREAPEASLSCPATAKHSPSALVGPVAAHLEIHLRAPAYSVQLSDQTVQWPLPV